MPQDNGIVEEEKLVKEKPVKEKEKEPEEEKNIVDWDEVFESVVGEVVEEPPVAKDINDALDELEAEEPDNGKALLYLSDSSRWRAQRRH